MNLNTINRLVAGSIPAGPTFSLLRFFLEFPTCGECRRFSWAVKVKEKSGLAARLTANYSNSTTRN